MNELEGRRFMNGFKRISKKRIEAINLDRTLSANAGELQGRITIQAQNDAITLWSEE